MMKRSDELDVLARELTSNGLNLYQRIQHVYSLDKELANNNSKYLDVVGWYKTYNAKEMAEFYEKMQPLLVEHKNEYAEKFVARFSDILTKEEILKRLDENVNNFGIRRANRKIQGKRRRAGASYDTDSKEI